LVTENAFENRCTSVVDRGSFPSSPSLRDDLSHRRRTPLRQIPFERATGAFDTSMRWQGYPRR
jgi:hypothetical protein